jgi:hypothetical protein
MVDIMLDDNNDLLIADGDFNTDDATTQDVVSIITSYQGWWKQFPLIGCAAPSYLNSPGDCEPLRRQIQIQLQSDGKQLLTFDYSFDAGNLILNVNGQEITVTN